MAVSGKTAAPHEIPYFLDGDQPPDMAAVTKAMADQAHARLNAIAPKQITGVAKKQLLIANAAGVVTAVLASGDVTNDESGKFTIANDAVTEAKIKDASITSRKLKPTKGVVRASSDLNIINTSSYATVPGTEKNLVVPVKSILIVTAIFEFFIGDSHEPYDSGACYGVVNIGGADTTTDRAIVGVDLAGEVNTHTGQGIVIDQREVAAGEVTIKLRAKNPAGGSWDEVHVEADGTKYLYELFAV